MLIQLPQIGDSGDKSSPFVNRIRKNYRHIRKMGKRTGTDCFRIYDRDIKEYPFTIDFYAGRFLVQHFSYQGDEVTADEAQEILQALQSIFSVNESAIFWRTRYRRKKTEQYEKLDTKKNFFVVHEYGVPFWVNLEDYLDTGLFLDHRETRQLVANLASGKKLLNLFAYTCSFSVHAAYHGAVFTKSVDLSNTYTDWGRKNFLLNDLSLKNNVILREDCIPFLEKEKEKYDLIVIDPPTLSRSKKMSGFFDVQKDHIPLLSKALKLLLPGGSLFFSTNFLKFQLDLHEFSTVKVENITLKTIPLDFRNQKIHQCWRFFN